MLLLTALCKTAAANVIPGGSSATNALASTLDCTTSADKGEPVLRIDKTDNYDRLEMKAIGEVFYTQSAVPTFKVYGPSDVVDAIDVRCDDGTLTIDCQTGLSDGKDFKNIKIFISSPSLEYVLIDGIAEFNAEERWEAVNPVFMLDGIGRVKVRDLRCKTLEVTVEGIGEAEINVRCDSIVTTNHGIGKIKLRGVTKSLTKHKAGIGKTYTKGLRIDDGSKDNESE